MNWLIYTLLIIMSLMSMNINNLFFMWMFLEMSSMTFVIYLNINSIKIYSILYFLISSISSILILFSIFNHSHIYNINYLLLFSMWLKLGMFPLNSWMNFMMNNINYLSLMPLLTIMKIIPMLIFIYFIKFNSIILTLTMIIALPPVMLTFNTTSYPLLMNYSSMYNMPLILTLSFFNLNIMTTYLILYMNITLYILFMLNKYSVYYKNSLNLNMPHNKLFFNLNMFMYAQLPPFSTFIMKWNLINYISEMNNNFNFIMLMMIFCSLMITFNYLNFNNINYFLNNMKINHKIYYKTPSKLNYIHHILMLNFMMMFIYMFAN